MELNKEQALRLWNAQMGRKSRAVDYAGRQMDKSAYNQRSSDFGWNVDHIYPQSKGGKTADYNLICCNIRTNDEKADRFPCFQANGKSFEIQRRQNHYEIVAKSKKHREAGENFFDAGQILDFWEREEVQQEYNFVGYVKLRLTAPDELDSSFIERFTLFLKKLFHTTAVFMMKSYWVSVDCKSDYSFTIINFDVPRKEDTQNLLDECILLNTAGQGYLNPKYGCTLRIFCGMKTYLMEDGLSSDQIQRDIINRHCGSFRQKSIYLAIHGLVWKNTSAYQEIPESEYQSDSNLFVFDNGEGFYPYDKKFPEIEKTLEKYL